MKMENEGLWGPGDTSRVGQEDKLGFVFRALHGRHQQLKDPVFEALLHRFL
jgi:hypothetical protein